MNSLFTRENIFHLIRELAWLSITGLLIYAILHPITSKMDFIYWKMFSLFIFVTLTYFRYAILFKSIPWLKPGAIRFVIFTFNIVLFFFLMQGMQKFLSLYENFYTEDFGFPKVIFYDDVKEEVFKYLYLILTLFGTGSLLMIVAFQFRLIISYWQYYKYKAENLMEG